MITRKKILFHLILKNVKIFFCNEINFTRFKKKYLSQKKISKILLFFQDGLPGPNAANGDGDNTFAMMAMMWVVLATVLYLFRPQSMRGQRGDAKSGNGNNRGGGGSNQRDDSFNDRDPPAVM